MVDCKYILLEKSSAVPEITAACVSSFATVKSAYLQLFSGVFNLIAAGGAVFATLLAAKIQIKPLIKKEELDNDRKLAVETSYRHHMRMISHRASQKAGISAMHLESFKPFFVEDNRIFVMNELEIPEDFSTKEWKNLSVLGIKLVTDIYNIRGVFIQVNIMINSKKDATVISVFEQNISKNYDTSGNITSEEFVSSADSLRKQLLILEESLLSIANECAPNLSPITQLIGPMAQSMMPKILGRVT